MLYYSYKVSTNIHGPISNLWIANAYCSDFREIESFILKDGNYFRFSGL